MRPYLWLADKYFTAQNLVFQQQVYLFTKIVKLKEEI